MYKRKLDDVDGMDPTKFSGAKRIRLQRLKFDGALSNGQTLLHRAFRTARGFERQKLGRRQKEARAKQEEETIARLEAEVKALKDLDLAATAELYLYRTICKVKSLTEAPAFPSYIITKVDSSSGKKHDAAYTNVTARLYSSNPARTALQSVLTDLKNQLGTEPPRKTGNKRLRKADYEQLSCQDNAAGSVGSNDGDHVSRTVGTPAMLQHDSGREFNGLGSQSDVGSGSVDCENYAARLANSSSLEGSDAETSRSRSSRDYRESNFSPILNANNSALIREQGFPERLGDEEQVGTTSSGAYHTVPLPTRSKSSKPIPTPKSTTFLPSLTMGGYWSGSDSRSENSDDEAGNLKRRKNRRGQRARRALAEKKFGALAMHVKNAPPASRDQGWDLRKGAQGAGDTWEEGRKRRQGHDGRSLGRGPRASGANNDPVAARPGKGKKEKGTEGKMHPSWEAAKKRKEQKTEVEFAGKKIVFE